MKGRGVDVISLAAFVLLAGCARPVSPASPACIRVGDGSVELTGVLAVEMHYGPPNYGENPATDERYHIPVLRLDSAIGACTDSPDLPEIPTGTDSLTHVTEIQLQSVDDSTADSGSHVLVFGALHGRAIGPEYLPIVMMVDSLKPARK